MSLLYKNILQWITTNTDWMISPALSLVFSVLRRWHPAAGGVLPVWRPTELAGDRLSPALPTSVQPELPGHRLSLSLPVERGGLATGKPNTVICMLKQVVLVPRMNLLWHIWARMRVSASVGGTAACQEAKGEGSRRGRWKSGNPLFSPTPK